MFRSALKLEFVSIFRPFSLIRNFNSSSHPVSDGHLYHREKCSTILCDYGFNPGQINRILKSPYSIISLGEKDLLHNLTYWLEFGIGDKLLTALCAHPELITLDPAFIKARVKELMSLFTKKDINKLIVTCPSVFIDDFSSVHDRVQYLVYMMGFEQKSIVKSRALQFNLNHMKCRHSFMVRAGKFKIIKKTKNKNAPLDKIFSRNIETYLKLTRLSEEEFVVFCRCFENGLLDIPDEEELIDEELDDED